MLLRAGPPPGSESSTQDVTVSNSLSVPRTGLVGVPAPSEQAQVFDQAREVPSQTVSENGRPMLYFIREMRLGSGSGTSGCGRQPGPPSGAICWPQHPKVWKAPIIA